MKIHAIPTALLLTFSLPAEAAQNPWAALLVNDVGAMHKELLENHPGAVDTLNKEFSGWIETGYRQALARAKTCDSYEGYRFALEAYAFGFRDVHLGAGADLRRDGARWPGFLTGWRSDDGKLIVRAVGDGKDGDGAPPIGSEIVSCDGKPVRELLERDVFPFMSNPALDHGWDVAAPELFVDESNPWRGPLPKSCKIIDKGAASDLTLVWRDIDYPRLRAHRNVALERPKLDFVIRPFGERGIWVGMPSFSAHGEATVAGMKAAIARAPAWRDRDPIVFDVRNNGGGSSLWGKQLLEALYGKDFVATRIQQREAKEYVEWRASPGNLAYIGESLAESARKGGPGAELDKSFRQAADGITRARAAGKALWRRDPAAEDAPKSDGKALPNPVQGRVFLLTDSGCVSACLDFADLVRALPGNQHVGRTTFADSVYMEARYRPLPSGIASFSIPMKVYRNRPRGNNEPYVPHQRWSGNMADTGGLERWIVGLPAPKN